MRSQGIPIIEIEEDERLALIAFLREASAADRFPLAPCWRLIESVLAKLDPQPPRSALPPLKSPGEPSVVLRKMRGRRR